jgi:DNA-binding transcriptional regulator GbsR (MarR family)
MTEISVDTAELPAAVRQFVLAWGDMGGQWGVNRSVSQIHALLYLSEKPLTADDIAEKLGMARSNVSNSMKELQSWNLIRRVPVLGDRRDHFEAETDVWTIAANIVTGRKRRELDPALASLRACVDSANADPAVNPIAARRLKEMQAFTQSVIGWFEQMERVPRARLAALLKLGSKVVNMLPGKKDK